MAYDIGPKIGIEGEQEFKNSIKAINSQIKALNSELKTLSAEYDDNDHSVEGLTKKQQALTKAVDASESKVKLLTSQYNKQNDELKRLEIALERARKENGEGSEAAIKAESALARQATTVNNLESQLQTAKSQLASFNNQLQETGNRATLTGAQLEAAGDKVIAAGEKISSAGNALTLGVTTPLIAAGAATVSFASDYEEAVNKTEVAFGKSADQVKKFAETTVDNYGIAEGTALDMAALFGDMATSMEIPQDEAANMSSALVGLAGDLASFKNISLDEASTALKSIFTGETESLKNLGVVMTETNLKAFALSEGLLTSEKSAEQVKEETIALKEAQDKYNAAVSKYGASSYQAEKAQLKLQEATEKANSAGTAQWESLSASEKTMIRYQYVLAATANAHGDYARTADGTANSLRTAQESAKELAVAFGQELLPEVTPLIQGATKLIKEFAEMDEEEKQLIIRTAAVAAAAGPALKIVGTATTGLGKLTKGIGTTVTGLGKLAASGGTATEGVSGLAKGLSKLGPKGLIITGVVAGAAAIGAAVLKARDDMIDAQIDEHFGDISLSAQEVEDVAKRLTTTDWTVKIDAAVEAREKVAALEDDITATLDEINKLNWKVSVGLELTEDEKSNYQSSVENFIVGTNDYLSQQGYSINLALNATLGENSASGSSIQSFADAYLSEAQGELTHLGETLATIVSESFRNNSLEENSATIQALLDQINSYNEQLSNWEHRATLSKLEVEYSAEGYSIDKKSFEKLNEAISENTQEYMDNAEPTTLTALTAVELQYDMLIQAGASEEFANKVREDARTEIEASMANNVGETINVGFNFAFDTLSNNFSTEITQATAEIEQLSGDFTGAFVDAFKTGELDLQNAFYEYSSNLPTLSADAKKSINDMLEQLAPQKEQLEALRDEALAAGRTVPESVSEGLSEIALWEAMAGGETGVAGMYDMLAQALANDPAKLEMLTETQAAGRAIPEELATSIAMYTGYVYNSATGMWEQISLGSETSAEEVAAQLNEMGGSLDQTLADAIAEQYGLVYENGKYMVDQAAQGATDNKQTFINASKAVASAGVEAADKVTAATVLTAPSVAQIDMMAGVIAEMREAQNYLRNHPLSVRATVNAAYSGALAGLSAIPGYYAGGIVDEPQIAAVAENGSEAIIPLENNRERALDLWYEAGQRLNAFAAEQGRSVGQTAREQIINNSNSNQQTVFERGAIVINTQATDGKKIYRELTREMELEVKHKEQAYGNK